MHDQQQEHSEQERTAPEAEPAVRPLDGFTVGVTAARRAEELGALLERRGAQVMHAPALRIVPLPDDTELLDVTRDLIDQAPDVVVATTAIGFRGWVEAAEGWGLGEALLDRLAGVELLARGPKVRGAIRAAGLTEKWSPASESMAEVLDRLLAEGVSGRRVALQLHGEPLPGFVEALRAGGAEVVGVPVYRWMPPEDIGPVDRLLDAVVSRAPGRGDVHQRAGRRVAAAPGRGARHPRGGAGGAAAGGAVGVRGAGDRAAAPGGGHPHAPAGALPAGAAGAAAVP